LAYISAAESISVSSTTFS